MPQELEVLHLRNTTMERRAAQDPQKETTLKDLRTNPHMTFRVEQLLPQLDHSSNKEREDEDKTTKKSALSRYHTLESGKGSKLTACMVNPQLWPHSHLSLSYVSKEKKYDLTLASFTTKYAAIHQRPILPPQKLSTSIVHPPSPMYLVTQFTWSLVRDLQMGSG